MMRESKLCANSNYCAAFLSNKELIVQIHVKDCQENDRFFNVSGGVGVGGQVPSG
jgi:hypothetical protein